MPPKKKTEAQYAKQRARDQKKKQASNAQIAAEHAAFGDEAQILKESEEIAINDALAKLSFSSVAVPSDGDCLFHSLLHQARAHGSSTSDAKALSALVPDVLSLRKLLAEYMMKNVSTFAPFVVAADVGEKEGGGGDGEQQQQTKRLEKHCAAIAKGSETWGSHLDIVAAASFFNVDIRVVTAAREEMVQPLVATATAAATGPRKIWTIVHWERLFTLGEHFTPVAPASAASAAAAAAASSSPQQQKPAPKPKPKGKQGGKKQEVVVEDDSPTSSEEDDEDDE